MLIPLLLSLLACAEGSRDFGFELEKIETRVVAGVLTVDIQQKLVLSNEAKEALNHGVVLAIITEVELLPANSSMEISRGIREFEVTYLPLSNRYQLITRQPHSVQTFPRLRHVLAEIDSLRFSMIKLPLPSGNYLLRARSHLDKSSMPAPMRLPAWFSAHWDHDSGWQSTPLNQAGET